VMCKPKPPRQSAYPSGASRCRDQGKTHGVTIPGMKMPVPRVTASCGQQTPMRNPEATSHYINAARTGTPSMSHVEGSGRIWVRSTILPEVPPFLSEQDGSARSMAAAGRGPRRKGSGGPSMPQRCCTVHPRSRHPSSLSNFSPFRRITQPGGGIDANTGYGKMAKG
jgi:hypothetical protein